MLARLELQQYVEGTYPSDLQTAKTDVEMAKITVKNKEDDARPDAASSPRASSPRSDVKNDELEVLTAKNDLAEKTTDLEVLEKYTHEKDVTAKKNEVAQAEKKLVRVQRENASNLAQKVSDLQQKEQSLHPPQAAVRPPQGAGRRLHDQGAGRRDGGLLLQRLGLVGPAQHAHPARHDSSLPGADHPSAGHQLDEGGRADRGRQVSKLRVDPSTRCARWRRSSGSRSPSAGGCRTSASWPTAANAGSARIRRSIRSRSRWMRRRRG